MMRAAALAFLAIFAAAPAHAGAWTQREDDGQIIVNAIYSFAGASFDSAGRASQPASFGKLWTSIWAEYGWNNDLTFIVSPEFARATTRDTTGFETRASDFAIGGGFRYRITNLIGVLSLQATVKSAGAFDMSVAVDRQSGEQAELRLLYGHNFSLFGHSGFLDVEAGERWIAGARPDETPIDFTIGIHVIHNDMLMLQSFNVISGGDARPPYGYYRSHKLELSWVVAMKHGVSLQTGGYFCPAGQNSLDETGGQISLWVNF
jgi:hypothetical protein